MRKSTKILLYLIALMIGIIIVIPSRHDDMQVANEKYSFDFEVKKIDNNYAYLIDKQTGVMYLRFTSGYDAASNKICAMSVMLNPDGTPKIWEGYQ